MNNISVFLLGLLFNFLEYLYIILNIFMKHCREQFPYTFLLQEHNSQCNGKEEGVAQQRRVSGKSAETYIFGLHVQ